MVDGLLYRDLLLVDLDELTFGQLFDLIWHLRLTHFGEVDADLLVDALEALEVALGHLVAGSSKEYGLKDEGK